MAEYLRMVDRPAGGRMVRFLPALGVCVTHMFEHRGGTGTRYTVRGRHKEVKDVALVAGPCKNGQKDTRGDEHRE